MNIKTVTKHWQTTGFGIFTILSAVATVVNKGSVDTDSIALFTTGLGLICAKDGDKTGIRRGRNNDHGAKEPKRKTK